MIPARDPWAGFLLHCCPVNILIKAETAQSADIPRRFIKTDLA